MYLNELWITEKQYNKMSNIASKIMWYNLVTDFISLNIDNLIKYKNMPIDITSPSITPIKWYIDEKDWFFYSNSFIFETDNNDKNFLNEFIPFLFNDNKLKKDYITAEQLQKNFLNKYNNIAKSWVLQINKNKFE